MLVENWIWVRLSSTVAAVATPLVDTDAVSGNAGIAGTGSVTRIQPCMKDWNDVLVHRAEIPNRNYFKSIVLKEPSKPETVKILRIVSRT